jgi:hypothetical protein
MCFLLCPSRANCNLLLHSSQLLHSSNRASEVAPFFGPKLCDLEGMTWMDWISSPSEFCFWSYKRCSGEPQDWDEVKKQASEKTRHISMCQCWKWVRSVSITMLAIIMILISYFLHQHSAWVNLWCVLCTFPGYSEHWQSFEHSKQFLRSRFSSSSCTIFLQVTALFSS